MNADRGSPDMYGNKRCTGKHVRWGSPSRFALQSHGRFQAVSAKSHGQYHIEMCQDIHPSIRRTEQSRTKEYNQRMHACNSARLGQGFDFPVYHSTTKQTLSHPTVDSTGMGSMRRNDKLRRIARDPMNCWPHATHIHNIHGSTMTSIPLLLPPNHS